MKITVRCFFIPADVTFDVSDVDKETAYDKQGLELWFESGRSIVVDRQHYYEEKAKIG